MEVSLTEDLWNTLNPERVEDSETAWMFSDEFYFTIWKMGKDKVFSLFHPNLNTPVILKIDPWTHTAGDLSITTNKIEISYQGESNVLFEKDNVIPFRV